MQSTSASDGTYTLTVTFAIGTDPDKAQILVQNQVSAAISSLARGSADPGRDDGKESRRSILEFVALVSPDSRFDSLFLSNYAVINVQNELARLKGVGAVTIFGAGQYAMRIWMNPDLLQARGLTPQDVINAIQEQSQEVTAGQVGAPPAPKGQDFQYTLDIKGRLDDAAEFENIVVKVADTNGGQITTNPRHRPRRARRPDLQRVVQSRRPAGSRDRHLSSAGRQRHCGRQTRSTRRWTSSPRASLAGLNYVTPYDTTKFVQSRDQRGLSDADRGRRSWC